MRKIVLSLLILILIGIVAALGAVQYLDSWSVKPLSISSEVKIELRPRLSLAQLSRQIADQGLVTHARLFQVWMRLDGGYGKFQAGTYLFNQSVTPTQIRDKMILGDIYIPEVLQVVIPEGFTLRMLNERLATKGIAQLAELTALVRNKSFIKELGVNSSSLEGYTYPATYSFSKMPTGREFYTTVVKKFFDSLPSGFLDQVEARGLSLNDAVTFASLIELETMQEAEKPIISEVIWRRLKQGDALGIDAAIIYGISNYAGDITWNHLKDKNNPYNTRIHRGLPPTAIGAVSKTSLEAVLKPTNLGYYYYMLDADDQTKHVFSRTAAEHGEQVKRFLKSQKSEIRRGTK
jgi:UPF0755 protein